MHRVFIAIGTNLGDRNRNIEFAIKKMETNQITVIKKSPAYSTMPYGYKNQPMFLNCVVEAQTALSVEVLLHTLQKIEKEMGRIKKIHWGPRIIDLDIIFFDSDIVNKPDLQIPHPDMHSRDFVLKPLKDIAPDFVHPILHKTVKELLEQLTS
ncbi:MAG: 2-amino-4-hydroxy-6-hydroxymethyldihydropteridine diphosphokinase [Caldisericota bacterium]|nr:2-amino-4-hydroxy-6-hydroxymethyldihydropteridine diphosphokinase [Caldisericota bacterium]